MGLLTLGAASCYSGRASFRKHGRLRLRHCPDPFSEEAPMKPLRIPRWSFTNCCGHYWSRKPESERAPESNRTSRRDFFKTAAAGAVGLAAMASLKDSAQAQVRVFPPPPPAVSPIEGLIDFHNHNAPDVFGRAVDDDDSAQLYIAPKMEDIVLHNHVALTANR